MCKFAAVWPASALWFVLATVSATGGGEPDRQGIDFFEKKIRPVLVEHCYECHSAEAKKPKGELFLDTRQGTLAGGESGHAVVPGNSEDSLLLGAIRYEDFEMPPDGPLPESTIADFGKWIAMGAPDPRDVQSPVRVEDDAADPRQLWSFQPIQKVAAPPVARASWPRTDIDRFILARLESRGIQPVADADPQVLVRRVYFDLIGLPPTPEQLDRFVADPSPEALAVLIDRLLDSPQFGQRWGRHWLDVVRYGESTGMERNFTYPFAWRYRDYVIDAFNDDKPFDRFIAEQVAGDLLPADSIGQRNEQLIATGMLAMGPKSLNNSNKEKFTMDVVDEQIDVTTQAFMALTVSCARCHDHKFDPVSQEEYYALAGVFCSTETYYGTGGGGGNRQQGKLLDLSSATIRRVAVAGGNNNNVKKAKQRLNKQLKVAKRRLEKLLDAQEQEDKSDKRVAVAEAQVKRIQGRLKKLNRQKAAPLEQDDDAKSLLVMAVQDTAKPSDTRLRVRGEATDRGDSIVRGFPVIASCGESPRIDAGGSGRLQYARWLGRADNPLTARVAVNRVWQHLFGRGIVSTLNNFGANGSRPTHPELLDHLAGDFIANGWSVKGLIRRIVQSRAYQLSSRPDAEAERIDPDNNLHWRMNQRRLEAESIRDRVLAASGQLDLSPGVGSVVEAIGNGDIGRNIQPQRFAVASTRRSVYLPIVRGAVPEILYVFDFPDASIIFGQREVTTVPTQALYLMNSSFVIQQSRHFARRLLSDDQMDDAARVHSAYRLALARSSTEAEIEEAVRFIESATAITDGIQSGSNESNIAAWAGFCQALFACSEFRYVD